MDSTHRRGKKLEENTLLRTAGRITKRNLAGNVLGTPIEWNGYAISPLTRADLSPLDLNHLPVYLR
ncbi:hypothetical protein [Silvimonas iriomotensis]|uniref:hypothetical protein n=1 Tax=Silvimonas iriomotensis TaxID=449662 RepID=UPI001663FB4B|nr:hypothetical protein [Silvimonas iriomotensis]